VMVLPSRGRLTFARIDGRTTPLVRFRGHVIVETSAGPQTDGFVVALGAATARTAADGSFELTTPFAGEPSATVLDDPRIEGCGQDTGTIANASGELTVRVAPRECIPE